jgi:hypothetical protein
MKYSFWPYWYLASRLTRIELHDTFFAIDSISKGTTAVTVQAGVQIPYRFFMLQWPRRTGILLVADETVAVAAG